MEKKPIILLIAFICFIIGGIIVRNMDTDGGKVKSSRLYFTDADGYVVSGILYQPKTATKENPAPAMLTTHGGDSIADTQSNFNIELARRGYVVLSYDSSGHGYTEKNWADDFFTKQGTMAGDAAYNYLASLPFVNADQMGVEGHSMGGIYTFQTAVNHQDTVKLAISNCVFVPNRDVPEHSFNYVVILNDHDQGNLARVKTYEACLQHPFYLKMFGLPEGSSIERGKLYGDWKNGTARVVYGTGDMHEGGMYNKDNISAMISSVMNTLPAPNPIDPSNLVYWGKIWGCILAFLSLVVFTFAFAGILIENPFAMLKRPYQSAATIPAKSKTGIIALVVLTLIPVITFYPGTGIGNKLPSTTVMALSQTPNGFITWGWLNAIVLIVGLIAFHYVWGKKNGGNAIAYGLSVSDGKKMSGLGNIGWSLLFAVIVIGAMQLLSSLFSLFSGSDITIISYFMRPLTPVKFLTVFPFYVIMMIPYFFLNNIALSRVRFDENESVGKGLVKAIVGNTLAALIGLTLLMIIFVIALYIKGPIITVNFAHFYTTSLLTSVLPTYYVATAINAYVAKKTNNFYAGLFCAILFAAWMMVACNAVSRSALVT